MLAVWGRGDGEEDLDEDRPASVLRVGVFARPRTSLEHAHVYVPVSLVCSRVVDLFRARGRLGGRTRTSKSVRVKSHVRPMLLT